MCLVKILQKHSSMHRSAKCEVRVHMIHSSVQNVISKCGTLAAAMAIYHEQVKERFVYEDAYSLLSPPGPNCATLIHLSICHSHNFCLSAQ
jgi:hypothetical protein